jgi:chromate transporter
LSNRLTELAQVFFKLGAIAFGGPAAHIAMMEQEIVERRQWMGRDQLMDLLGVTNLIPGPNSTELAIHIGYERAGWKGLLIAGSCFILPAMAIVWGLAIAYSQYQTLPQMGWLFYGIKPVIIALILQAIWKLSKSAIKNYETAIAALLTIILFALQVNEILLLLLIGLGMLLLYYWRNWRSGSPALLLPLTDLSLLQVTVATPNASWMQLFLIFLKIGCVLYGGGYVLFAFLQRELVEREGLLTAQQLLDAIAIGQVTPGPLFTTATFIGYLIGGHGGAIAATIGIFLPAFFFVAITNPWIPKLRQSALLSHFLDGVNAAALGLMVSVTWQLGRAALVDGLTIVMAIVSLIVLWRFRINSLWLVLAGAAVGAIAQAGIYKF